MFSLLFNKKSDKHKTKAESIILHEGKKQSESIRKKPDKESVSFLIKEATDLKSKDINQSIELIKKVIELDQETDRSHYFKLGSYYSYAGRIEEAYKVYNMMLQNLNMDDVVNYNWDKSQILEKLCTVNYKNGEYENYLFNYTYWLYNLTIAFACQGQNKALKDIINNKNKLVYLAPSKVDGCFKKLEIEKAKEYFNEQLNKYFNNINDELKYLTATKAQKKKVFDKDDEFMKTYLKLNDESFCQFYNLNIKHYSLINHTDESSIVS